MLRDEETLSLTVGEMRNVMTTALTTLSLESYFSDPGHRWRGGIEYEHRDKQYKRVKAVLNALESAEYNKRRLIKAARS
jgi:hypothetical protein